MILVCFFIFLVTILSWSGNAPNHSLKHDSKYNEFYKGNHKSYQTNSELRSNVILMIEILLDTVYVNNFKLAAKNILKSFSDASTFTVIISAYTGFKTVELTSKEAAIAFIEASRDVIPSHIAGGYAMVESMAKKVNKKTNFCLLSNSMKTIFTKEMYNAVKLYRRMGVRFSVFQIYISLEGVMNIFDTDYELLYYLPQLKVPFGIFWNRWNPEFDKIKVVPHSVVTVGTNEHKILKIVGELKYYEHGFETGIPFYKFRNIVYDPEINENNTEINTVFTPRDKRFSKMILYVRFVPVEHWDWVVSGSHRMNDYGLEPDSIEGDRYYTMALYCHNMEKGALYQTEFLVKLDGGSMMKIFHGTSFRIKDSTAYCGNVISPARISSHLKVFKRAGTIYCIFLAVGDNGMTGSLSFYRIDYAIMGSGRSHSLNYKKQTQPYSVVCFEISNQNFTSKADIYLQIQPVDGADNAPSWSKWVQARNEKLHGTVCGKKVEDDKDTKSAIIIYPRPLARFFLVYLMYYLLF